MGVERSPHLKANPARARISWGGGYTSNVPASIFIPAVVDEVRTPTLLPRFTHNTTDFNLILANFVHPSTTA